MAYAQAMAVSELARLITEARKDRGWSQEKLAEESGVGRRTIIRWETEADAEPLAGQLRDVARTLGVPVTSAFRAVGWLPPADERPAATLQDYTDAELIAELQRRMDSPRPAPESGRRTA